MLKIYGRANSINVRKVLWAADEIGIAYSHDTDWGRGYKPLSEPEFLALNSLGLIPVIDDDGFILSESNTIARYLAAKHGRTDLLPADPKGRAGVERWMDWQSSDLTMSWRGAFLGLVAKVALPGGDEVIQASLRDWPSKMRSIEGRLAETGAYMAGPSFTLADIPIGLSVHRWFAAEVPVERPDLPATSAYYERLSERPPFMTHVRNGLP
ncbi:MAG TPA: glutathione S-transferase family protein [Hyphomicrobiales bacterium]|jgi:glutathione S-transferase